MFRLLLCEARIVRGAFCLDDGNDFAVWTIEGIVRDAVLRLGIFAVNGDFKLDLRAIPQVPPRACEGRVNQTFACFGFAESSQDKTPIYE